MKKDVKMISGFILSIVLIGIVSLTGCDSGGGGSSSPTAPSGTATLQGQILKEPTVQIASSANGLWDKILAGLAVSDAWAVNNQPIPVPNMKVSLSVDGQFMGNMMTDDFGRFRFDGMKSGMYDLMIQDQTGRYTFNHSMSMGMGETIASYGVMWMNGGTIQMTWDHLGGDHWDDMMRGVSGGRWDMGGHRWMM